MRLVNHLNHLVLVHDLQARVRCPGAQMQMIQQRQGPKQMVHQSQAPKQVVQQSQGPKQSVQGLQGLLQRRL